MPFLTEQETSMRKPGSASEGLCLILEYILPHRDTQSSIDASYRISPAVVRRTKN